MLCRAKSSLSQPYTSHACDETTHTSWHPVRFLRGRSSTSLDSRPAILATPSSTSLSAAAVLTAAAQAPQPAATSRSTRTATTKLQRRCSSTRTATAPGTLHRHQQRRALSPHRRLLPRRHPGRLRRHPCVHGRHLNHQVISLRPVQQGRRLRLHRHGVSAITAATTSASRPPAGGAQAPTTSPAAAPTTSRRPDRATRTTTNRASTNGQRDNAKQKPRVPG